MTTTTKRRSTPPADAYHAQVDSRLDGLQARLERLQETVTELAAAVVEWLGDENVSFDIVDGVVVERLAAHDGR